MNSAEAPAPLVELRRLLRIGGLLVWLMVGAPVVFHGGLDPRRLVPWAVAAVVFAVAFWASSGAAQPRVARALLAFEGVCVLAMVLLLCDGFEGALLVLISLELAGRVSRRAGIIW